MTHNQLGSYANGSHRELGDEMRTGDIRQRGGKIGIQVIQSTVGKWVF